MSSLSKLKIDASVVLIVDDVLDNLAVLHDALDESGFIVLVANNGTLALERANKAQPNIILLDAMMPDLDGFEVCKRLKADANTTHIPVIFMTGLTEVEHIEAAFTAGGIDYVTKPIRPKEVIARITAHLQTAKMMHQARGALDAFGQAAIAITPQNGKIVWQTPLARQWLQNYFSTEGNPHEINTPALLFNWIKSINPAGTAATVAPLSIIQGSKRLIFSASDISNTEQWMVVLNEESDAAKIEALMATFSLTHRESEVLYWVIKGKTSRDIGDILEVSPRTINKHLEHVFVKLGVETRTAAASLVTAKLRIFN